MTSGLRGQDDRFWRAALTALAVVLVAGAINVFLITYRGLNPISYEKARQTDRNIRVHIRTGA